MFHSNTKVELSDNPDSNYNDSCACCFKPTYVKVIADNMASQFLQAFLNDNHIEKPFKT